MRTYFAVFLSCNGPMLFLNLSLLSLCIQYFTYIPFHYFVLIMKTSFKCPKLHKEYRIFAVRNFFGRRKMSSYLMPKASDIKPVKTNYVLFSKMCTVPKTKRTVYRLLRARRLLILCEMTELRPFWLPADDIFPSFQSLSSEGETGGP